jgi:dipeptidase D
MSDQIRKLEPRPLWNNFADLNAIPRASKKEERIIAFMQEFGKKLNLPVSTDEAGNVLIKKPATKGMENRQTIVLQSHLDMVHQKNADTNFDFSSQGIEMIYDNDWVRAKGTTLGADNGIGVAAIMSVLHSNDIPHPAIEALLTIDEETGMTGALALKGGVLSGSILLNLDTEEDNELTIGCAGGIDVTASAEYSQEKPKNSSPFQLQVKGLSGGHSGMNISEGRGNANKIMNRILFALVNDHDAELANIAGGGLRNAIPRESLAVVVLNDANINAVNARMAEFRTILKHEYSVTDPNIEIVFTACEMPAAVCAKSFASEMIRSVYACPVGIYRMSPDIKGLVQTSNNLARIVLKDGKFEAQCLSRSSVESEKADLKNSITAAFELCGAKVVSAGDYPGWTPQPTSEIVKLLTAIYAEKFKEQPHVSAVHAGLECGILGRNYPAMQMISFGPNIRGAHSPDEKVQVSSVQKFWDYFLEILKRIPKK